MSTYASEKADNLKISLESLYGQTIAPERIVLVVDGEIDGDQEAVLADFSMNTSGPKLTLVRLPQNGGLAAAMNAGLAYCDCPYVMRMDSDDVCLPDRLEHQVRYMHENPDIDLVSCWSEEFGEGLPKSQFKVSPTQHEALRQALCWRNVIAHSGILVRTETLRRIGGYRADFGLLEDYDLYVRLMTAGARFHVIPKVMLRVRTSLSQKQRRGNFKYALKEIKFRLNCLRVGFIKAHQFLLITTLYTAFRIITPGIRQRLYALSRI
jgi:GT2 family glycosyltransferase